MLIAELNRWITIEKATRTKDASIGNPKDTYSTLYSTWAGVSYGAGSFNKDNAGSNVRVDAAFTIRYDSLVNYKCRIIYEDQVYIIDHIEIIGRNEGMRIKTILFTEEV
jgi:head-tail adaptor